MAVALRRRLDTQAGSLPDTAKTLLVIGHAPFTPGGFVFGDNGLEYTDAPGGDGRVPLKSALLPGVRTWQLDATHGDLPTVIKAFPAYLELLTTGATALLEGFDASAVGVRSAGATAIAGAAATSADAVAGLARSRPSRGVQPSAPPSTPAEVLGVVARSAGESTRAGTSGRTLHVSVLNADLKFVHQPLVVGHYRSLALTGTEDVVDRLVGKAMSRSLAAGLYPDGVGTHQIFGNIRKDPTNVLAMARPLACIVAGLGEEGKLRAVDLVYTVRQAVIAYAQRLAENEAGAPAEFELAATLIGSGGTGINAGSSAQMVAQGTWEANQKLHDSGWPQVGRLILVEFYLDRASDAWRALQVQSTAAPNQLKVVGFVESGAGALRRSLDSSYRGAAYDFISATTGTPVNGAPTITYTLDTKRARAEVRAQKTQASLVKELVAKASNDTNRDAQIGRTLFDLLVPVEMEPFLGGTSEMVIELDGGTAALPWEVLDTSSSELTGSDPRPWAIRSKLLRKLRTADFRAQVSDADADGSILVIGEPMLDEAMYPPLPGARAEAVAVAARLTAGPAGVDAARVRALTGGNDDARNIINALFERPVPDRPRRRPRRAGCRRRRRPLRRHLPRRGRGQGDAHGSRAGLPQLLPPRRARCQDRARELRPGRVRRRHRRSADRDRRALRHRRRLGGRGQAGRAVRDHVLRRAARRRPLHRRRRGGAQRGLEGRWRRQHLVGVPVLRRPGLDLAARRRRCPARADAVERRVRRRLVAAGFDAGARDDLDQAALRRRRGPGQEEERRAGAARQDPFPRSQVRAALGQDGRGRRGVRPRLRRCARRRQGDRLVPRRGPRR